MRGGACTLLILGALAATALAQSAEQVHERHRIIAGWLGVVRAAESKYRSKYRVYGDLQALRNAHLLNDLVFESDNHKKARSPENFIPKGTRFEVTASDDGKHYKFFVRELSIGGGIEMFASEQSSGFSFGGRGRVTVHEAPVKDIEDGPEGPLLASPT